MEQYSTGEGCLHITRLVTPIRKDPIKSVLQEACLQKSMAVGHRVLARLVHDDFWRELQPVDAGSLSIHLYKTPRVNFDQSRSQQLKNTSIPEQWFVRNP